MLLLVSGATSYPRSDTVGHLIVPRQWNHAGALQLTPGRWAMDNGAYSGLDVARYMAMLERFHEVHRRTPCLFVAAPDVVGDASATLQRWPFWSRLLRGLGYPVAFVLQDGIGTRTPWPEFEALFIGGTTTFKLSLEAARLMGVAKALGKHVHVGRVNSAQRAALMAARGADSHDGSSFSWHPQIKISRYLRLMTARAQHEAWRRRQQELPL